MLLLCCFYLLVFFFFLAKLLHAIKRLSPCISQGEMEIQAQRGSVSLDLRDKVCRGPLNALTAGLSLQGASPEL